MSSVVAGCTECEINPCASSVGWGGSIDDRGNVSLDALIMDGCVFCPYVFFLIGRLIFENSFFRRNHQAGSVAGLFRVKNAIGVAHAVLKYSTHTLLVGEAGISCSIT